MAVPASSSTSITARAATLPEVVRWRSEHQSTETAFIFLADGEEDEQRLTYAELNRRAAAIASALVEGGAAGSRALLVYDSGLDYIAALYGCFYAGVVAVPVYPPDPFRVDRTLPRLQAIVNDAGANWLLATAETLRWAKPLFANLPGLASSLATDELTAGAAAGNAGRELPEPLPDQPALLQYTSGSTGVARGVTITHANLLANLRSIHVAVDRENNVAVLWLPAYHDMGLIGGIFQPVFSGRTSVLMSPVSFMQRPVRWLKAVTRYRGTVTAAPNFAYDLCVRKLTPDDRKELDLSSLLTALNGAEIIRPETLDRFSETFAECGFRREAFLPCYGLAEATLMVAGCQVEKPPVVRSFSAQELARNRAVAVEDRPFYGAGVSPAPERAGETPAPQARAGETPALQGGASRLVGCGQAVPGQRIVIVGPESLLPLEEGEVGEIWVAGESIGQGYWNHPEESEVTFRAYLPNGEGPFLRTGDLGFFDDGELFIAGRRKELIIIQGRNHYPHDIEDTVWRSHPLLKADGGAAFSIDVDGEERLAIVQEVIRPKKADLGELIERVRSQVAEVHGVPVVAVALIPAGTLPKTSSGKKQRRGSREQFLSGDLPSLSEWRDERLFAAGAKQQTPAVAPRTQTELKLAAIWSDVLGVEARDIHANFFDLGGQSLLAGQLAARVQESFAIEMPLRVLFANPSIAALATWLDLPGDRRGADALPPVTRADRSQPLPLSSSQEQLWFLEQLESEPRYNLAAKIHLRGPLNVAAFEQSLESILSRHEALRTRFPSFEGMPRQVIADAPLAGLSMIHETPQAAGATKFNLATGPLLKTALTRIADDDYCLSVSAHHLICDGWSLAILLRELADLYGDAAGRPSPVLQRVPNDEASAVIGAGRPASPVDGWTTGTVILREAGQSAQPPLGQERGIAADTRPTHSAPLDDMDWHYADFAVWQRNCLATPQLERQLEYWKRQLNAVEPLNLITDYHRGANAAFRGASVDWAVDKPVADALTHLAQREGATLYMVLLAAFQTLLGRYARQHDVCVGSPVSYRPRREFERSIGYFVNTLVLRTDLSGEPTFRQLLARVRETVLDALANGDAPLPAVVDAVAPRREAGRTPLFNVMFVFENLPWQKRAAAGVTFGEIEIDHTRIGSYDLGLVVEEQPERLKASLVYNAELFDSETIEAMGAAFRVLLDGLAADADAPVMRIPLVAAALRDGGASPSPKATDDSPPSRRAGIGATQVAAALRDGGASPSPRATDDSPPRSVGATLVAAALRDGGASPSPKATDDSPPSRRAGIGATLVAPELGGAADAVAVTDGRRQITYGELQRQVNQLAHHLQANGVGSEVPVAIYLDRSIELVVAMLAVLKAGGAYVPFDTNEAAGRLEAMLADTEPRAILTTSRLATRLPKHSAEVITLDRQAKDFAQNAVTSPPPVSPDALAYIIYTSGSSGQPKGVEVSRASLSHLVQAMADTYELSAGDRVLQIISPAFDVAAEEIYPTLLRGGTLVLGPPTTELTGRAILDVCRRERVSVAHVPPPLWQQCLLEWQLDDESLFEHLRLLLHGGEAMPAEAITRWLRLNHGRVKTLLEFGLTETTVTNLVYPLPIELESWSARRKLPIGRPIAKNIALVLDEHQQAVPRGAPGELYLGGPGVARGYHHLPEATEERFVSIYADGDGAAHHVRFCRTGDLARWLRDGNLEFLGRIDTQIKLRGLRIEPGEIERVLLTHPAVREAAVMVREDVPGARRLVAYLVPANGQIADGNELRAWLRTRLSDSLVPSAFVAIDCLPLNRSHKLDRDALPPPPAESDTRSYTAPRSVAEKTLADVWQAVLKADRVGVHDNFFELGGDSVLTIQVVARAREAGLRFTPRQLFEHQTIAELAAVEGADTSAAEQGQVTGDVPLTPVQHWFLTADVIDPHHFNQTVLLRPDPSLDPRHLPDVFARLIEQHDALRLRFARGREGWRQFHALDAIWPLERIDLSELPACKRQDALTAAAGCLQAALNLEQGPMARAAWFDLGAGQTRLLMVVHHLVVDAVSWRVLLEDLTQVWQQLESGQAAALPPKTTSFKQWAERLADYAGSYELERELAFWQMSAGRHAAPFPVEADGENRYGDAVVVSSEWSPAETGELLNEANKAYRTQTNELLLAALGQTLSLWAGGEVPIDVEGHGRSELFDEADLSRTVGWFTAWRPHVTPPADLAPGALLRQTKEALRAAPHQGLGFGLLRYLSPKREIRERMAALPRAEVSFNYLGRLDDYLSSPLLAPADESAGPTRSPRAQRSHKIEVNAYVLDDRLRIDWTFCRNLHRRETVERLAADFRDHLAALVAHCLSPDAGGSTPSDFPLAQLNEGELDQLSKLLGDQ